MRSVRTTIIFSILLILVGCASQRLQPINVTAISAVQSEIKRQIGIYMLASREPTIKINDVKKPIPDSRDAYWCGSGAINFDISSIKAELTTTLDSSSGLKVGIAVPFTGGSVSPSAGLTHETVDSQVLDYNLWPLPWENQNSEFTNIKKPDPSDKDDKDILSAPIAQVLLALRSALIQSAMKCDYSTGPCKEKSPQPCFTDYNLDKPAGDAGDLFKIALSITNDTTGGILINVGPITFGATGEAKSMTGNTLYVSFIQRGVQDIQKLKDVVDVECKYPKKETSPECVNARSDFKNAIIKGDGVGVTMPR